MLLLLCHTDNAIVSLISYKVILYIIYYLKCYIWMFSVDFKQLMLVGQQLKQ